MTSMKRMSVAEAKAHFSELVADARRGKKTVILRHGKPAAAVVPAAAVDPVPKPVAMTREQALAVFESFAHLGDPAIDAVAELKAGRR
jgi:prevent-host-death family protein